MCWKCERPTISPRSQAPAWERDCAKSSALSQKTNSSEKKKQSFWSRGIPKLELGNERKQPTANLIRMGRSPL